MTTEELTRITKFTPKFTNRSSALQYAAISAGEPWKRVVFVGDGVWYVVAGIGAVAAALRDAGFMEVTA